MTDQRVFKFGMVTFQDGSTMDVPVISGSSNGWVYKPDMLRTKQDIASGKDRAWPRGSGFYEAEKWMNEYVERQLRSRNWEIPVAVEKTVQEPETGIRYSNDGLAVSWINDPWGWVTLSLEVIDPSKSTYGRSSNPAGPRNLTYKLTTHELAIWCFEKELKGASYSSWPRAFSEQIEGTVEVELDNVRDEVLKWMRDPWKASVPHIQKENPGNLRRIVDPPDLRNLSYDGDNNPQNPDETIVTNTSGKIRFYKEGEIVKVLKNEIAWDELNKIFDAYRFLGYKLRITSGYDSEGSDDVIHSITIEVPPGKGIDNALGHTVVIDANRGTIGVACGYVQDEARWVKRQTRIAKNEMAQLEEDLFTEYEIPME